MVILDTSVIIDHLRGVGLKKETTLLKFARKNPKSTLVFSVISIQELHEGQSTLDERKEEILLSVLNPLNVLPYTYEIAKTAGELARDSEIKVDFADFAIAATAIVNGCDLLTLNQKHFKNIPDLVLSNL